MFKIKPNIFDLLTFAIIVFFAFSILFWGANKEARDEKPMIVTIVVEGPEVETIYGEAKKTEKVHLNSANNLVKTFDVRKENKSLFISLLGDGKIKDERYIFNGSRILINQKAEVRSSYFAQGRIISVEYAENN